MTRPEPLYRIHDTTPNYSRAPRGDHWDVLSTAASHWTPPIPTPKRSGQPER